MHARQDHGLFPTLGNIRLLVPAILIRRTLDDGNPATTGRWLPAPPRIFPDSP
jgi:hypothetical protein